MKKLFIILLTFACYSITAQGNLNLNLISSYEYPNANGSDIWGWEDGNGNEYALVGLTNGISVVDITAPSIPIERFFISGVNSTWRDIKTWNNYAYVTTEGGGGLLIIDLNDMTGNTYSYFTGFDSAHNIYIDENGIAYIFGYDTPPGEIAGVRFYDVDTNPWDPQLLGDWDEAYVHDGMVRGDTLWVACIYAGIFYGIDVSNKANPINLGSHSTPSNFTHNIWISDDGNYVFTTDEVSGAYIGAYDISNMTNIIEVDMIQSSPGMGVIPHNTHVDGNFIVTSYYTDGTVIHDVTYPYNIIEVAYYDSYSGPGGTFSGCWGTYPFLPSGIIISSEMNSGPNGSGQLLIYEKNYQQACYLEGNVSDAITGIALINATVELLSTSTIESTNLSGNYSTGTANASTYQVKFSMPGYISSTLQITLSNGVVSILDAELTPMLPFSMNGIVLDGVTKIEDAFVRIENEDFIYETNTDEDGSFDFTLYESTYDIIVGKWGYITYCGSVYIEPSNNMLTINLTQGYYDDFSFDFGWNSQSNGADSGFWEIGDPNGTTYDGEEYNPEDDVNGDCGSFAFITGNLDSGSAGSDDVDEGSVSVISPLIDLTSYDTPYIRFFTWFANGGGMGSFPNDSMVVYIDDGIGNIIDLIVLDVNSSMHQWNESFLKIEDYITPSSAMHIGFYTEDADPGHLVEAGFDGFQIIDSANIGIETLSLDEMFIYPNPIQNSIVFNVGKESSLKILDLQGRIILSKKLAIGENIINTSELELGIYLVYLTEGYFTRKQKVLKF